MKLIYTTLFLLISYASISQRISTQDYISKYKDIAISEMKRTGIPASITLAQGIIESESGNSKLVRISNNHFGIKCNRSWVGKSVKYDDDSKNECFRKYENDEDSFKDHSDILTTKSIYKFLFDYDVNDYKSWSYGLMKAGYATSTKYAKALIRCIEEYNLQSYTTLGIIVN